MKIVKYISSTYFLKMFPNNTALANIRVALNATTAYLSQLPQFMFSQTAYLCSSHTLHCYVLTLRALYEEYYMSTIRVYEE